MVGLSMNRQPGNYFPPGMMKIAVCVHRFFCLEWKSLLPPLPFSCIRLSTSGSFLAFAFPDIRIF
jgi:hypothetical protein